MPRCDIDGVGEGRLRGDRNLKASQTERQRKTKKDKERPRERSWFVLKRPRGDINGESESEVTVTSKLHAHRGIGIDKVKD